MLYYCFLCDYLPNLWVSVSIAMLSLVCTVSFPVLLKSIQIYIWTTVQPLHEAHVRLLIAVDIDFRNGTASCLEPVSLKEGIIEQIHVPKLAQMVMSTLTEQATNLLDFNQKLDIQLLDNVVSCMYAGDGPQVWIYYLVFCRKWICQMHDHISVARKMRC